MTYGHPDNLAPRSEALPAISEAEKMMFLEDIQLQSQTAIILVGIGDGKDFQKETKSDRASLVRSFLIAMFYFQSVSLGPMETAARTFHFVKSSRLYSPMSQRKLIKEDIL